MTYSTTRRMIVLAFLATTAYVLLANASTTAAHAVGTIPPPVTGTVGAHPGGSNHTKPGTGTPGSPTGGSGGGGGGGPATPSQTCLSGLPCWTYGTVTWNPNSHTTAGSYGGYGITCGQKADQRWSTGFTWGLQGVFSGGGAKITDHFATCSYASPPAVSDLVCGVDARLSTTGPLRNAEGVASSTTNISKVSPFQGSRTVGNCATDLVLSASREMSSLGRWELQGTARLQNCQYRNFAGSQTDLWDCSGAFLADSVLVRPELRCDGWSKTWTNPAPTFSYDSCTRSPGTPTNSGTRWTCTAPAAMVAGARVALPQVQKGHLTPIVYPKLTISGSGIRAVRPTAFGVYRVTDESTPHRIGAADEAQLWTLTTPTSMTAAAYFFAPGTADQPWSLIRTEQATAQFQTVTVQPTVNATTGSVSYSTSSTWTTAKTHCDTTVNLAVFRPRISN